MTKEALTSTFQFPPGGHLLQFLSCLESALHPAGGTLEPPLTGKKKGKKGDDEEEESTKARMILPLFRKKKQVMLKMSFISLSS